MKKMSDDPALWPEQKERVFIIGPVRNINPKVVEFLTGYVKDLEENKGYEVFWSYRDNPYQDTDKIGIQIITLNREKMIEADEIHIWYDKNSTGSVFDFGMLFLILITDNKKRIRIINDYDVKTTPYKSFENVLLELRKQFGVAEEKIC